VEFEHGGYVQESNGQFIDFSSNVNPLPFPKGIRRLKARIFESVRPYPDPYIRELCEKVSSLHGLSKEEILFGNGSSELIYLSLFALKPRSVCIPAPTFSEYERASKAIGAEIERIELDENFLLPLSSIKDTEMLIFCHPNNPTGNYIIENRKDILSLNIRHFIIDEAFIEFSEDHEKRSFLSLIKEDKRIIVIRTFTKLFPLAGVRIGYMVAEKEVIERIKAFKPPWNVNGPAMVLASSFLEERGFVERTRKLVKKEREYLIKELKALGFKPYPSVTNFILFKLKEGQTSKVLRERLQSKGIMIRDCSNFSGLDERFVRIAVKTRKDNKRLIEALKEICLKY